MKDFKDSTFRLEKLSDDHFNGQHPNGIFKGYVKQGRIWSLPTVDEVFCIGSFMSSPVLNVISESDTEIVFKTTYSTYKLTKLC